MDMVGHKNSKRTMSSPCLSPHGGILVAALQGSATTSSDVIGKAFMLSKTRKKAYLNEQCIDILAIEIVLQLLLYIRGSRFSHPWIKRWTSERQKNEEVVVGSGVFCKVSA